jgi:hypothetical protein
MTKAQHTPGPWKLSEILPGDTRPHFSGNVYGADNYIVANCNCKRDDNEIDANARLIAAAPELLERNEVGLALVEAAILDLENVNPALSEGLAMWVNNTRAAIAKAKGE